MTVVDNLYLQNLEEYVLDEGRIVLILILYYMKVLGSKKHANLECVSDNLCYGQIFFSGHCSILALPAFDGFTYFNTFPFLLYLSVTYV